MREGTKEERTAMPSNCLSASLQETKGVTRRGFYMGAMYAIWGAISACLGGTAFAYLFFPPKARKEESWIDIGDITYLAPNQPVEMTFHRNRVDGWKSVAEKVTAWVVKTPAGITAFGPRCTHLGCAHHWDDARNQFVCPCHNSFFSITGEVVSGPAPRPLDRYQTKIQGATLLVGQLQTGQLQTPPENNA